MKTITEFSGFTLKEAIAKKAALLTEGKSEDEAQAAVNEILKLDEAKAPFYKNAVDMTSSRIDRVKRVVVAIRATEAEKVPESFMEREGHFYLIEYFPEASTRGARKEESSSYHDDFARGRTGGGGGRGGDRGRRPGGADRGRRPDGERFSGGGDSRPPREPREPREQRPSTGVRFDGAPHAPMPAHNDRPPAGARPPRGPRPPRAEGARTPREPRGPKGAGELRLVLKGHAQTTLAGSGPAVSASPTAEHTGSQE